MIERLYVHNYRCFENFSINFEGLSSALIIGKNGAGKSTLRQSLGVFQSICRGSNRVKDLIVGSDFTQQRTDIPMRFEVELKLSNKRFKYAVSFELPENFREARVAEEHLSVDGNTIFSRENSRGNARERWAKIQSRLACCCVASHQRTTSRKVG